MDVEATIEETAKDAAVEATKVAADEATKDAHEEAAKGSAAEAGKETGDRTDGIPAAGALGTASVLQPPVARETVVEDQPSTSKAPLKQIPEDWRQLVRRPPWDVKHQGAHGRRSLG
jgi:hypothetical protein